MQALVYHGPGQKKLDDRAKPVVKSPTDAIVRISKTTICGTDLHILKGDVPTCKPGTTLGHEGVGVIDSVGPGVVTFKPGDRVPLPSKDQGCPRKRGEAAERSRTFRRDRRLGLYRCSRELLEGGTNGKVLYPERERTKASHPKLGRIPH